MLQTGWTEGGKIQDTKRNAPALRGKESAVKCTLSLIHIYRVNDAVFELLQKEEIFTREIFLEQAHRHRVCPFELCLDTASWADNIICDYTYVFDPNVYLRRFFAEGTKEEYLFLVAEAHNLVERARSRCV